MNVEQSLDEDLRTANESRAAAAQQLADRAWPIFLFNRSRIADRHFVRALVGWRTGQLDAFNEFENALRTSQQTLEFIATHHLDELAPLVDPIPGVYSGSFSALLVPTWRTPFCDGPLQVLRI